MQRSLLFYKFSLVSNLVAAQRVFRLSPSVERNRSRKVVLSLFCRLLLPPSKLHMSLQFHFLHSSHARSIVPRVSAADALTSSSKADFRRCFLKEGNGLCAEVHKGQLSRLKVRITSIDPTVCLSLIDTKIRLWHTEGRFFFHSSPHLSCTCVEASFWTRSWIQIVVIEATMD